MPLAQAVQFIYLEVFNMINEKFIETAKEGNVLVAKCKACNNMQLSTIIYCLKCGSNSLEYITLPGKGNVITYTILHVPPEGYEQYAPYAWVVFELESNNSIRVSGFLANIKTPADLPLNSKVKIIGYDERGIVLSKA